MTFRLERHAELDLIRAWRHEVCAAERGQEVVEGVLVRQIDQAEAQLCLSLAPVKQIVHAETQIKEVA